MTRDNLDIGEQKRRAMRAEQLERIDPMDEPRMMDSIQSDFEQRECALLPFEPDVEMRELGEPGRGKIDHPEGDDGWVEPGPNDEEDAIIDFDNLVADVDENWEDELLDL